MPSGIFICHRRADTAWVARYLRDHLRGRTQEDVFLDVDSIGIAEPFNAKIKGMIRRCRVMLVLIGRDWLCAGADGRPRIAEPGDVLAQEIALGLEVRGVRVIPVRVDGAPMPDAADLPVEIQGLCDLNAAPLRYDNVAPDMADLVKAIGLEGGGPVVPPDTYAAIPRRRLGLATNLFTYPWLLSFVAYPAIFAACFLGPVFALGAVFGKTLPEFREAIASAGAITIPFFVGVAASWLAARAFTPRMVAQIYGALCLLFALLFESPEHPTDVLVRNGSWLFPTLLMGAVIGGWLILRYLRPPLERDVA